MCSGPFLLTHAIRMMSHQADCCCHPTFHSFSYTQVPFATPTAALSALSFRDQYADVGMATLSGLARRSVVLRVMLCNTLCNGVGRACWALVVSLVLSSNSVPWCLPHQQSVQLLLT
jgi:hypothetical protein